MGFKGDMYIWKDRRRRMGMPLSFTRYALSEDRLFLSTGFFSVKDEETLLYRVRDISLSRTFGQRLCGVGTITITSSDKSNPTIILKNVKDPKEVKVMIHSAVEEIKIRRRVRLEESMGGSCCHHDHETVDDDDDDDDEDDDLN